MDKKEQYLETIQLHVDDIRIEKPFSHFFPVNPDTVNAIRIDMKSNGFDSSFPLIVWQDKHILVDGHTRFMAARELGMEHIPVIYKSFENEDDAVLYAFHLQRNRRNLSDDDIIRCLEILDKINIKKKDTSAQEKTPKKESVAQRAKDLGTSKSKIEKAMTIIEHGSDEIKESVQAGKASINKAYQDIQTQRRESGELKGARTTGLASDANYNKTYQKLSAEIRFLKDENWIQISREKVLGDLEILMDLING